VRKVKKQKNNNLTFRGYYEDLSNQPKAFIDTISVECSVTRQTVYNWMSGRCKVPALAQEKINKIVNMTLSYEQN